jgi:hypothetical protein
MFLVNLAHIFIAERALLSRENRRPEKEGLFLPFSG